MKMFKLITLVFIFAQFLSACQESAREDLPVTVDENLLAIPENMGGLNFGGVILPEGTTSSVSSDKSTVTIRLPENFVYLARLNNELLLADEGGYTCTSTCSGGCDVVKLGKDIGCSACPEGSTEQCVGQSAKKSFNTIGQGSEGGFIDLSKGISFVRSGEEATYSHTLPTWDVIMMHPEVQKNFNNFIEELWPEGTRPAKSDKLARLNVYGTYIRVYIPADFEQRMASTTLSLADAEKVDCNCSSSEEGGCDHEDVTIGSGILKKKIGDKCVAGACTSCTMTW